MAELLGGTALDDWKRMFTDVIRKSGTSLLGVINDILDFSKIDAGHLAMDPQPFKLSLLAYEPAGLVAHVASEKRIELAVRIRPGLPAQLTGDLARLRQVVTNLLSNAIKFTEAGQMVVDLSAISQRTGPPLPCASKSAIPGSALRQRSPSASSTGSPRPTVRRSAATREPASGWQFPRT